jgi:uncharacterized protein (TIGR03083 family)
MLENRPPRRARLPPMRVAPIHTAHLFAPLHDELMALLRSLSPGEWNAPTVAGLWTVKDVAAHLLDTALRRLSIQRDRNLRPGPFDPNAANREWIAAAQRLSPRILIEMMDRYGGENAEYLASLDPDARAEWGVAWAGEDESPVWFDVARELTERWHHQQQIRDATNRPPLYDPYLAPVLATFMRALPVAYRNTPARVVVHIDDATWSLADGQLIDGPIDDPSVRIRLRGDRAWRLFTRQRIDPEAIIEGDAHLAQPLFTMTSVL